MKMFLTRLGFQSKMIITGDITQIDLPRKRDSGLMSAQTCWRGSKHRRAQLSSDWMWCGIR